MMREAARVTTTEPTTEILCAIPRLGKEDALNRVHGGVRFLWRGRCSEATLWYKPLWEVRAHRTRGGRGTGDRYEELIAVVDGLTGIARCLRPGSPAPALTAQSMEGKRLVPPAVDAETANDAAQRVIRRNARRRRLQVGEFDKPTLFYKPVWLIAHTAGGRTRYAVDAESGVLARVLG